MNRPLFFSAFVFAFWALSEGASRPSVVKVGAIFTLKSINARVSKVAIEAAERDVNSDKSVLGETKLSITFRDSNYSGFLGILGGIILFSSLHYSLFLFNKKIL